MPAAGWIALCAAAIALYAGALGPCEASIRAALTHAHDLYDLARRNDRILARAAEFTETRERVRQELRALSGASDSALATLAAIRLLKRIAERHQVALTGFSPSGPAGNFGTPEVGITLAGRYADLVPAIAELSRGDVLLALSGVRFSLGAGHGGLEATIRGTIYDSATARTAEVHHGTTAFNH